MTANRQWIDIQNIGIEGQGWTNGLVSPYDRLPAHARDLVSENLWNLSRSSTGMCITFVSDTKAIHIRRELASAQLGEHNFNNCAFSGFDLYADDHGQWRWIATTPHSQAEASEYILVQDLPGKHTYRMYLPLRNQLLKAEIGIDNGSSLKAVSPRRDKPIVFYGSSIIHGAYASHAGLSHPSLLGRRLNKPIVNLGFSGSARMEKEVAALLGELDPAVYVIDPMPNMDAKMVQERAKTFLQHLRSLRPHTPFLLMEDAPKTNAWFFKEKMAENRQKWQEMRKIYKHLQDEGENNIFYLKGNHLFGTDNEASIDGIHPGDLGLTRMADKIYPLLRKIIAG